MLNQIKIIGGKFKGKKLMILNNHELRPTASRVRETLFNWLMHNVNGSYCLDLFAGSGALGIEALSRGAKEVCFVEKSKQACDILKKNLPPVTPDTYEIINDNAETFLEKTSKKFDIIFFDPPFKNTHLYNLIYIITTRNLLTNSGFLYVESPQSMQDFINNNLQNAWILLKEKFTKHACYALYQRSIQ